MNALDELTDSLCKLGHTVTCVESCTGGLLSAALTEISGSSQWFQMGFITYSNEAKQQLVGVQASTLAQYGAVSHQVVEEMATGALNIAQANYALSISGVAGPLGGTPEKPVGTVWIGLATEENVQSQRYYFHGQRHDIRQQAVQAALQWLAEYLSTHCFSVKLPNSRLD